MTTQPVTQPATVEAETTQPVVAETEPIPAAPPPGPKEPARPRPVRRPLPFEARLLSEALGLLAIGVLGLAVFLLVVTPVEQSADQDRLYAAFRQELANATAPTGGLIDVGSPVAVLGVPGLRLDNVVVEGTSSGDLRVGPGHRRDTPLPGQAGVSLLYGRSVTYGAPFDGIDRLRPGDRITATTGQGTFTYRVRDVRKDGDPLPPPPTTGAGRLVLETSTGSNPIQHGGTVYVDADLLDHPAVTPGGRPSLVPPEEREMASDTGSNVGLVLWLEALGVGLGLYVWGRGRWGRRETLLVGAPVLVAVVWNVYETVAGLLPNLV